MEKQVNVGAFNFRCAIDEGLQGLDGPVAFFDVSGLEFDRLAFEDGFCQMEAWGKAQGAAKILGPFNDNTLFPYRYRTTHFNEKAFWGEPDNGKDIIDWLKRRGYQTAANYTSSRIHNDEALKAKMTDLNLHLPVTTTKDLKAMTCDEVLWQKHEKEIYQLTLESFQGNFLFKPYAFEQFQQIYDPLMSKSGVVSPSSLLLMANDQIVGFCFNFEDEKNTYLKSIGIHPKFRRLGASFLYLLTESYKKINPSKDLILCLMKEGNVPDLFSSSSVVEKRSYALFEKSL